MSSSAPASENYCHNPAVDAEWERLLVRHEGDPAFTYLYSLRQDLCEDVAQGNITLNEAIDRFEAERQRIIDERLERLQKRQASATITGNKPMDKPMNKSQITCARHPEYSLPSILAIAAELLPRSFLVSSAWRSPSHRASAAVSSVSCRSWRDCSASLQRCSS